jgi:hypothetical protein
MLTTAGRDTSLPEQFLDHPVHGRAPLSELIAGPVLQVLLDHLLPALAPDA